MVKEAELVGAFFLSRREAHPFTDKQIALVMNFARQAAIAIENARLLKELLEDQSVGSAVTRGSQAKPAFGTACH
jgi:GAF domain-containing protein